MRKLKLKQAFLTLAIALIAMQIGYGQKTPAPVNVKVTNTSAEPVPVSGNVSVANTENSPLAVRDADRPTRQPFVREITSPTSFTIPEGKMLVLEWVTGQMRTELSAPEPYFFGLVTTPDFQPTDSGPHIPASRFSDAPLFRRWIFNAETKMYYLPGQRVQIIPGPSLAGGSGQISWSITLVGHYVDVP